MNTDWTVKMAQNGSVLAAAEALDLVQDYNRRLAAANCELVKVTKAYDELRAYCAQLQAANIQLLEAARRRGAA